MTRIQIGWLYEPLDTQDDIDEYADNVASHDDFGPDVEPMILSDYGTNDITMGFSHIPGKRFNPIPVFIEIEPGQYRV